MNTVTKFPDMRPPKNREASVAPLPTLSAYRRSAPAFPTTDSAVGNQRAERRRLFLWFGVAVALHAALLLTLWLTPPLRLKWGPSADDWVQVISLPNKQPEVPQPEVPSPEAGAASKPVPAEVKSHKAQPPVDPSHPQRRLQ
jgi:hypothetical protein